MGAIKGFEWLRSRTGRDRATPDPVEMGTAFGLDASMAAPGFGADDLGVAPFAAPPAAPGLASAPTARRSEASFWRRLGGRLAPGR